MKLLLIACSFALALPAFAEDAAGDKSIDPPAKDAAPVAGAKTEIKCNGIFAFEVTGTWKPVDGKKVDAGSGKTIYPGSAKGSAAGLAYFGFEDANRKTSEVSLKDQPWVVVQPIHQKMLQTGGKEESHSVTTLNEGNSDQEYFIYSMSGPNGDKAFIDGIILRTAKRIYIIQAIEQKATDVKEWREIAKSFREL